MLNQGTYLSITSVKLQNTIHYEKMVLTADGQQFLQYKENQIFVFLLQTIECLKDDICCWESKSWLGTDTKLWWC